MVVDMEQTTNFVDKCTALRNRRGFHRLGCPLGVERVWWSMKVIDLIHRLGFRCLYLGFRVYAALFRPCMRGTFVFVWVEDRFLAVRSSYRKNWSVPGGMVGRKEEWMDAACRELGEEVGIFLPDDGLTFISEMSGFKNPNERVQCFELRLDTEPDVNIDHREIVEARFMTVAEAREFPLLEGVERYLDTLDN